MSDVLRSSMKFVQLSSPGGPDNLALAEGAVPGVPAKHVLVKVAYAGVNGPDIMQRKGLYPKPEGASPVLGLEIAGQVVELGEGAERWRVGDAVCALTNGGGYAEYCAVLDDHCLP